MAHNPHFFFAVSLPTEAKQELKKCSDQLKVDFPFSRWVHEQDYHITLAFLGSAEKSKLELAKEFVDGKMAGSKPFPLIINQLGTFGRKDSPRIFWAGVKQEDRLHSIRDHVFSACEQAGFQLETRPFHPHITIARKWMGTTPFPVVNFEESRNLDSPIVFLANKIVLYQTHLDQIPKYEAVASYTLHPKDIE
ncbi:RNA 2',3'-cyclic phosphodiesterase [Neobacillus sp. LXY-4]|uniref:RNA 2',3'-cyclic phosphodiesterase n=1 Tax=Neobacillus sp. LXY-4 TaxID=3379826 RepID=UPI003EDFC283